MDAPLSAGQISSAAKQSSGQKMKAANKGKLQIKRL
jgi:hypothetical protein